MRTGSDGVMNANYDFGDRLKFRQNKSLLRFFLCDLKVKDL